MGSEWSKVDLLDFYDIRSGLSKPAKDFGSGYPFVSFKDVFYNYFIPGELSQLVQSSAKERENCSVRRGDIFLTRTSETMNELGMSSVALKDYEGATFNGFSKRLRPKADCPIYPEFIGYYLRSPQFRSEMMSFSTMSTRASLNNEMIGRLTIPVPPLKEQKNIAWVLKNLDNKIQLNRQTNQTLEHMAQALFKSWFVDFDPVIDNALAAGNNIPEPFKQRAEARKARAEQAAGISEVDGAFASMPNAHSELFPSEFEETAELGWVPKGWNVESVSHALNINPKLKLPKETIARFADMKAIPTSGYSVSEVIEKEYKGGAKFENGDVLLARITPCLENGKTAIVDFLDDNEVGFGSTEFIVLRGKGAIKMPYVAALARDKDFRVHCIQSMVGSSGRQRVQNACFNSYYLAMPSDDLVLHSFDELTAPMFESMTRSNDEANTLEQLRDTLLPKLISGELRLPESFNAEHPEQTLSALAEELSG